MGRHTSIALVIVAPLFWAMASSALGAESVKVAVMDQQLVIGLSFLGVRGVGMSSRSHWGEPIPLIDQDDLVVPESVPFGFDASIEQVLRPVFDIVWNATGYVRCFNYGEDGKWGARR